MRRVLLLGALLLAGCSMAPTDSVIAQLAQSDRSWCVSVTSVYGTLKMGGTGVHGGKALCNSEGLSADTSSAKDSGVPVELAPVKLRMVPQ